ncbi:MAG: DNA-3-methyladenine glycosylase I [Nitrospinaceae bacterium]|jgi:DNA-3-methyladenine glycosylase I|nr:DNA-3-methyladenine glycosylase I [Nitrospinaceae bacterium]MBT3434986.1 DNA-3-methyladenine glycosylase I [Nitrospinaceae bacterium]MBT3821274.1 DNA-3-methyladenine glycosylase I [Nitrospinaceae bacterium]MBT4094557.1 DNA-3-methyladenine glycosylase I [Nitrospinaceae bacterium]MBT4431473.1 DNA-3-methyladenine glycosylase I [Nitrospinaceae bacterium]
MAEKTKQPADNPRRCPWAEESSLLAKYHDEEWGVPVKTDAAHFERLSLEVFQAGLSWRTILHKRVAFRSAFARFSPQKVSAFTEKDIRRLLDDAGIVRHRGKIGATIDNAGRLIALSKAHGGFSSYLESLPGDLDTLRPIFRKEFRFMGPKISESYLESVGKIPIRHHRLCWKSNLNIKRT